MGIEENLTKIKSKIRNAELLIVTKEATDEDVQKLIDLGYKEFGENRIQNLGLRAKKFSNVRWHMIGHLQSNKARNAVELCKAIHSVDSLKLARKINAAAKEKNKIQKIFIEVNVSGEESKYGISENELAELISEVRKMENLWLLGLMTMAPFVEAEQTRPYFRKLKQLADKFSLKELSMGMSNDYWVAIEEGATVVRIGTAVFEWGKANKRINK